MSKIPAIPPLNNVQDRSVRDALQALTEGWQLRNGMTGDGTDAFVTASGVTALIKKESDRVSTAKTGMIEDSKSASMRQKSTQSSFSSATTPTGNDIIVSHPSLGKITLQKWLDDHVEYTINFENYVNSQLAAIKARLSAGGL